MPKFEINLLGDRSDAVWEVLRDGVPWALVDSYDAAKSVICGECGKYKESVYWDLRARMKRMLKAAIRVIEKERRDRQ